MSNDYLSNNQSLMDRVDQLEKDTNNIAIHLYDLLSKVSSLTSAIQSLTIAINKDKTPQQLYAGELEKELLHR